jgi:N-acetylglucosamine malate deacetylase 1
MKSLLGKSVISVWRTVVPRRMRNSLRLWLMLDLPDRFPQMIRQFNESPVLILAPHMDDEIIGPGGTAILHHRAGSRVTAVFLTDGSMGDPGNTGDVESRKHLTELRKDESRRAAKMVGITELVFLDGPDGALAETKEIVDSLVNSINTVIPALIYAPAVTDHHADHWATNRILRAALKRADRRLRENVLIRGYEVWSPLPANRMVDISDVAEIKKQAVEVFASQTKWVDYARTSLGLNQFRSAVGLSGRGFAEAFLESSFAELEQMMDIIAIHRPVSEES